MNSIDTLPHFLEYYTDISDLNIIFASYFGLLQFQYLSKHRRTLKTEDFESQPPFFSGRTTRSSLVPRNECLIYPDPDRPYSFRDYSKEVTDIPAGCLGFHLPSAINLNRGSFPDK